MITRGYVRGGEFASQAEYFLARLREAGDRGGHTFELRAEYIANPSERRAELEALGHVLSSDRERPAPGRALGARYRLIKDVDQSTRNSDEVRHAADPSTAGVLTGAPSAGVGLSPAPPTAETQPAAGELSPAGSGSLFDLDAYAERPAHYDMEAAA